MRVRVLGVRRAVSDAAVSTTKAREGPKGPLEGPSAGLHGGGPPISARRLQERTQRAPSREPKESPEGTQGAPKRATRGHQEGPQQVAHTSTYSVPLWAALSKPSSRLLGALFELLGLSGGAPRPSWRGPRGHQEGSKGGSGVYVSRVVSHRISARISTPLYFSFSARGRGHCWFSGHGYKLRHQSHVSFPLLPLRPSSVPL